MATAARCILRFTSFRARKGPLRFHAGRTSGEPGSGRAAGAMACRTLTGERVSLLGYGCMRWPMKAAPHGVDRSRTKMR